MHSCGSSLALCLDTTVQFMTVKEREYDIVAIDTSITIDGGYTKIMNQCEVRGNRLLTCSREPVVKLFEFEGEKSRVAAEFKGHEMSVTTGG